MTQPLIDNKQRKRLWQVVRAYCDELLEETSQNGFSPIYRFVHPQSMIDCFTRLGLRAPNNPRAVERFYDSFVDQRKYSNSTREVNGKSKCNRLVHGYIRNNSESMKLQIPVDIIDLCFIFYFYSTDHIKVFCRFKPQTQQQMTKMHEISDDGKTVKIMQKQRAPIIFTFDHIFDGNSSQNDVFHFIGNDSIHSLFEGYNAMIMAIGYSESGKTLSMEGIIDRSIELIYDMISIYNKKNKQIEYCIKVKYIQITNELITDLLTISDDEMNTVYFGEGIEINIKNKQDLIDRLDFGHQHIIKNSVKEYGRYGKLININHIILTITLKQINNYNGCCKESKLQFVDIGSYWGQKNHLGEIRILSQSMSALHKVIIALTEKKRNVCYTESVLTKILKDALGGNCKTSILITCSFEYYNVNDIISSLDLGKIAKNVKNKPKINYVE